MFKNPFSFNGRIRRTEYGLSFIIYLIVYLFIRLLADGQTGEKAFFILYIPVLWFLWAQAAKRCHDLDKSGWWQIIPFYGLWLLFENGVAWTNEYGENPKNTGTNRTLSQEDYVDPYPLPNSNNPGISQNEENNIKYPEQPRNKI